MLLICPFHALLLSYHSNTLTDVLQSRASANMVTSGISQARRTYDRVYLLASFHNPERNVINTSTTLFG